MKIIIFSFLVISIHAQEDPLIMESSSSSNVNVETQNDISNNVERPAKFITDPKTLSGIAGDPEAIRERNENPDGTSSQTFNDFAYKKFEWEDVGVQSYYLEVYSKDLQTGEMKHHHLGYTKKNLFLSKGQLALSVNLCIP